MKLLVAMLALAASLLASVPPLQAQFGTTALYFPTNARSMGMGLSGTADNSDPSGIHFNPANVVGSERAYLLGSQTGFEDELPTDFVDLDDWSLRRGAAGGSWKFNEASAWTFGANFSFAKFDFGNEGGAWNDLSEEVMSLTAGAGVSLDAAEIRFGASVKRLSATVPDFFIEPVTYDVDGYAYDVGVAIAGRGDPDGWSIVPQVGVAAIDLGSDLELSFDTSSPLPRRYNIGASVRATGPPVAIANAEVPKIVAIINADFVNPDDEDTFFNPDEDDTFWTLGAEASAAQVFFLRGGMLILPDDTEDEFTWGVGLGLPLESFRVRFDYSNKEFGFLEDHMTLLLAWVF